MDYNNISGTGRGVTKVVCDLCSKAISDFDEFAILNCVARAANVASN